MKRITSVVLLLGMVLLVPCAGGESVVGFVHAKIPSNGMAVVSMPFHPFGEGLLNDVLKGGLSGDDTPDSADSVSLWLNATQMMTNSWLAAFGNEAELDGKWVVGASPQTAQKFDRPIDCGDAFTILNKQPLPVDVFVMGYVPLDFNLASDVYPGLNLLSFGYPSTMSATNVFFEGMGGVLSCWDSGNQSYVQVSNGVVSAVDGFWAERTSTNAVTWMRWRPFSGTLAGNGEIPRITGMAFEGASAFLYVETDAITNRYVEVLTRNIGRQESFSFVGWMYADRIDTALESSSFAWEDTGFSSALAQTNFCARFYIVGNGDQDEDGDALSDVVESHVYGTDPASADTDGDGLPDGWEVAGGLNPLDGVGPNGSDGDSDGDRWSNLKEYESGTDPLNADTDGDGLDDYYEIMYQQGVVCWGGNFFGQATVPGCPKGVVAVDGGANHSIVLKSDGTIIGWGNDSQGQSSVPDDVNDAVAIAAGDNHNIALKSDGSVVCWGGDPVHSRIPPDLLDVVAIAAGGNHSLALKGDGTVVGWGYNTHGQALVSDTLSDVVSIAAGENHSMALKADGAVVCWGDNSVMQSIVPEGLTNATAIAAGENHSLAIIANGSVLSWGEGESSLPVPEGLTNVVAVAAGIDHDLALKTDGTVVAWQLDGSILTDVPVDLTNALAIASGGYQSMAVTVLGDSLDPLAGDPDGDNLLDAVEVSLGSDPFAADSDADGIDDGIEYSLGLNPLDDLDVREESPETDIPWLCYANGSLYTRIYVDCNYAGASGQSDGSQARPWTNLVDAVYAAGNSDPALVLIAPGYYKGALNSDIVTFNPNLVIRGCGPRGGVILDSEELYLLSFWTTSSVMAGQRPHNLLSNVTVINGVVDAGENMIIDKCVFVSDEDIGDSGPYGYTCIYDWDNSASILDSSFYASNWGEFLSVQLYSNPTTRVRVYNCFLSSGADEPNGLLRVNQSVGVDSAVYASEPVQVAHCTFHSYSTNLLTTTPPVYQYVRTSPQRLVKLENSLLSSSFALPVLAPLPNPTPWLPLPLDTRICVTAVNNASAVCLASGAVPPATVATLSVPLLSAVPYDIDGRVRGAADAVSGCSEYRATTTLTEDSDQDGLPDVFETRFGYDLGESGADLLLGMPLGLVYRLCEADTDDDGIPDLLEVKIGTSPTLADTDGDGLDDGDEIAAGTNLLNPDTDGDGLNDGDEIAAGTDPLNYDTDGDSFPDGWEDEHGFDPVVADDPNLDSDGDGLTDGHEAGLGTSPFLIDTDGDHILDPFDLAPNDPSIAVTVSDSNSVAVTLTVGDTSGSHTELYAISLNGITLRMPSVNTESYLYHLSIHLIRGAIYEGYVESLPDGDSDGDFDADVTGTGITVDAPPETLGGHFEDTGFNSGRRYFTVTVPTAEEASVETPDASAQAASLNPELAEKADPVNAINGNVRVRETDIAIDAPGLPLVFARHYNSASIFGSGSIGPGWMHDYEIWLGSDEDLVFNGVADTYRRVFMPDGQILAFRKNGTVYESAQGDDSWLEEDESGWKLLNSTGQGYRFDGDGRLLSVFDGLGNSLALQYESDDEGRVLLTGIEHSNGRSIELEYNYPNGDNRRGKFLVAAYPSDVTWHIEYNYDSVGRLYRADRVTDTATFMHAYSYEPTGFALTSHQDMTRDYSWKYAYTDLMRGGITRRACNSTYNSKIGQTDEFVTQFDYEPAGLANMTRVTSVRAGGDEIDVLVGFDPQTSMIVSEINEGDGSGFEIEHDSALNPIRQIAFEGSTTTTVWRTFDPRGNILTQASSLGSTPPAYTNSFIWHPTLDLPLMTINAAAVTNFFSWKDSGLMTCASNALGSAVWFAYTPNGLPLSITNALGGTTVFGYDNNGLLSSVSTPDGLWASMGKNAHGHLESLVLPGPNNTDREVGFQNDTYGRRIGLSGDWEGLFAPITRDAAGRIATLDDQFGSYPAEIAYGRGNRTASVSRMLDNQTDATVSFAYDRQWNLRAVSDELGRSVESYALDAQGRVAAVTNLEGQVTSVGYLLGGAVSSARRPISLPYASLLRFGAFATNEYDSAGNLVGETVSEIAPGYRSDSVQYTWRPDRLPLSAQSAKGTVSWTYDPTGSVTSETARVVVSSSSSITSAVQWALSPAGQSTNTTLRTANGTWQVAYAYDTAGRVTNIVSPAGAFAVAYNAWNGRVAAVSNAVLATSYAYDGQERLAQIVYRNGAGSALGWFTYGYSGTSPKLSLKQACFPGHLLRDESYVYDTLGRLYSGTGVPGINTYDLAGNRTRNGTQTWTYDADTSHITGISYDSMNNALRTWHGSDNIVPYYDIRGRIISVSSNAVYVVGAGYDALGRRVSSTERGVTTRHVYDGDHVIADLDASGEVQRFYTWGLGVDNLLAVTVCGATSTNSYYALKDHLNSVYGFVDAAGAIVAMYDYGAWGNLKQANVTAPDLVGNRYLWNGREYSYATGLYYFRARWYDPVTARWLSKDPIGLDGGINLYVYCGNDPVNFRDPWGLCGDGIASDAHGYWGGIAVSGFDRGGFVGVSQAAGASVMQAFIDFWGARSIEHNAGLSGTYSAQDGGTGKAIAYGALATAEIGLAATTAFAGNNVAHPFYRYVGAGSKPIGKGAWLVRGTFGKAPYGRDFIKAADMLQLPPQSMVDDVVRVPGAWKRYIAGPRRVKGNPQWGSGGGYEYRIGGF